MRRRGEARADSKAGYRADLATIGKARRERDIYFVVDAIHGVGAMTLDMSQLNIDVLACGGLSP